MQNSISLNINKNCSFDITFTKDIELLKNTENYPKKVKNKLISYKKDDKIFYIKPTKAFKLGKKTYNIIDKDKKLSIYETSEKKMILNQESVNFSDPKLVLELGNYLYLIYNTPTTALEDELDEKYDPFYVVKNNLIIAQISLETNEFVAAMEVCKRFEGIGYLLPILVEDIPYLCFINHFKEDGLQALNEKQLPKTFRALFDKMKKDKIECESSKQPIIFIPLKNKNDKIDIDEKFGYEKFEINYSLSEKKAVENVSL